MSVGVGVRKKWITHMSPVAARDAPRTHRHLRCHLVGSQVVLSYMHKVPAVCACPCLLMLADAPLRVGPPDRAESCSLNRSWETPTPRWLPSGCYVLANAGRMVRG